jgi:hypothetical protein
MTRNDRDPNTLDFNSRDLTHHTAIIPSPTIPRSHDPTIPRSHHPTVRNFQPLPRNPNVVEIAGQSM